MKYATMGLLLSLVVVLVVSGCVSNTGQTTGKQNTEPSHTQATIPETKQETSGKGEAVSRLISRESFPSVFEQSSLKG